LPGKNIEHLGNAQIYRKWIKAKFSIEIYILGNLRKLLTLTSNMRKYIEIDFERVSIV